MLTRTELAAPKDFNRVRADQINEPIDDSDIAGDIDTFLRIWAFMWGRLPDTTRRHDLGKGTIDRWRATIEAAAAAIEHSGSDADLSHVERPDSEIWSFFAVTDKAGRGQNVYLDADDVAEYNADPDLFVAKHFGFTTVEGYREWVETNNAALCSKHTKTGKPCRNSIGMTYAPEDWRQRHRSGPCFVHAKEVR